MAIARTLAAMMVEVMAGTAKHSRAVVVILAMVLEVMVLVQLGMDTVLTLRLDMEIMGLEHMEVFLVLMVDLTETRVQLALVTKVVLQAQIEDPGPVKHHLLMALEAMAAMLAIVLGITLLVVAMLPQVRPLVELQAMGARAMDMVDMEGMLHMLAMEDTGLMEGVVMALAILLPVEHLDMVQGMGVGVATLVIQVLGVILHKAVVLVVQSMEVPTGNQIMAVAMAVCNPGLLSKERQLECL
ncbi:unnamed protein product [Urochloa humidicola]